MARYKHIDTSPRFLAVDLQRQLLPGTFEHALNHLLDHELDLTAFDARFNNDATGAPAYPPAMLLKVILFAYSQGIVSSRGHRARLSRTRHLHRPVRRHTPALHHHCQLCLAPWATTSAHVFCQVLYICDKQGLIGREMFAIDGVKLPSNASKGKSGTRADFERQAAKLEAAAHAMLARHREAGSHTVEPICAPRNTAHHTACRRMPSKCTNGWRTTPIRPQRQQRHTSARATAPTTTPPRWPPAKA